MQPDFGVRTSSRTLVLFAGSDECAKCHKDSVCLDKDEVFTCSCKMGYAGNGLSCEGEICCRHLRRGLELML